MELDRKQEDALAVLARASDARAAFRVVPISEMDQHLASGAAQFPFGEFDGSPAHFQNHWWRTVSTIWEPVDEATAAILDSDLRRWQHAYAAIGDTK